MKSIKIIIAFITLSVIAIPSVFAITTQPAYSISADTFFHVTCKNDINDGNNFFSIYAPNGGDVVDLGCGESDVDGTPAQLLSSDGWPLPSHWVIVEYTVDSLGSVDTLDNARASAGYTGETYIDVTATNGMIENASSTMVAALGVSPGDVGNFMWEQGSIIAGSGLGVLQTLLPYIIALVTISAIVYFLYRAFRFYKH